MKIAIASDHGGFELKEYLIENLKRNHSFIDCGCDSTSSCDYPTFCIKAANLVKNKEVDYGIVICTTGIGMSICANKVKGIRCALCFNEEMASMTRLHNNSNMLALGSKNQSMEMALKTAEIFLSTTFSNLERHKRRIDLIKKVEEEK